MKKLLLIITALSILSACSEPDYIENKKVTLRRVHPITTSVSLGELSNFDFDKYYLLTKDIPELNDFIKTIKPLKGKLLIEGHTDMTGSHEYNITLSENRANTVKEYLDRHLDMKNYDVTIIGYGKTQPIHEVDDTLEKMAQNRRVFLTFEETTIED